MKVAMAGHERSSLVKHFGAAQVFQIYELANGLSQFVETRQNNPPCLAPEHEDHDTLLDRSVDLIADCQVVIVSRIGTGARDALASRGIRAVEIHDVYERALDRFVSSVKEQNGEQKGKEA